MPAAAGQIVEQPLIVARGDENAKPTFPRGIRGSAVRSEAGEKAIVCAGNEAGNETGKDQQYEQEGTQEQKHQQEGKRQYKYEQEGKQYRGLIWKGSSNRYIKQARDQKQKFQQEQACSKDRPTEPDRIGWNNQLML